MLDLQILWSTVAFNHSFVGWLVGSLVHEYDLWLLPHLIHSVNSFPISSHILSICKMIDCVYFVSQDIVHSVLVYANNRFEILYLKKKPSQKKTHFNFFSFVGNVPLRNQSHFA